MRWQLPGKTRISHIARSRLVRAGGLTPAGQGQQHRVAGQILEDRWG
jgi:hypothetical protein